MILAEWAMYIAVVAIAGWGACEMRRFLDATTAINRSLTDGQ